MFPTNVAAMTPWLQRFVGRRLGLRRPLDGLRARNSLLGLSERPIGTILDIGANLGKKARWLGRKFPQAHIYCVEPLPACQSALQKLQAEMPDRVTLFPVALAAQAGQVTMCWNRDHWGGSTLRTDHLRAEARLAGGGGYEMLDVPVHTLDGLLGDTTLAPEILLKLDVEGLELEVLRGGRRVLAQTAAVVVEAPLVAGLPRPSFAEIVALLAEHDLIYRGNLTCAYVDGVPHLADAVFCKRELSEVTC